MALPSKQERIEEFKRICRAHGLPVTTQRRVVLESILDRTDHPTADQVYEQVKERLPGLSRTTVYRILDTLVELGTIHKTCHPGSAARFDPMTQRHHHLVCTRCESIIDVEGQDLGTVNLPDVRALGFEIDDYHIHFRGVCAACRSKQQKGGRAAGGIGGSVRKTQTRPKKKANKKGRTEK